MQSVRMDERAIMARLEARTARSFRLFQRALRAAPGGVNAGIKYFKPYPIFMDRAEGSHIWDVDGNKYIDYLMSYGAIILGHGAREVGRATRSVLGGKGTTVFGTPTAAEVEYAEMLRDIYHPGGLARFTNSGLEATLLAVRISKGFTGKQKVAKFEGHYHGAVDRLLYSYSPDPAKAGRAESPTPVAESSDVDPGILRNSLVLPFNDWTSTESQLLANARDLACVILEPFEEGVIPGEMKFMLNLRKLTKELGIPLIYDEVKTGFRVRIGGASEFYSIHPDLTCLGKIIGGGLPIGAVVGDNEMLSLLDPRGPKGARVFHSGTFNGNPLSVAVGREAVTALSRRGRFDALCARTGDLKRRCSRELSHRGVQHSMVGEGAMFNFYLTDRPIRNYRDVRRSDLRLRRFIDLGLITAGVYLKPENRFCLSLAHSEADTRQTAESLAASLDNLTADPR